MKINVQEVAYHRNGICGVGFHAVRFSSDESGKPANFIATVFPEPGCVAVICLDLIEECGVKFCYNSWRGDHFEDDLRAVIRCWNDMRVALSWASANQKESTTDNKESTTDNAEQLAEQLVQCFARIK